MMYLAPAFLLLFGVIVSSVFLATANFGFGGRARYPQILAVWFYGTLPLAFISIITMVLVSAGVGTEAFNIKNAAGTNIGYFLQDGATPRWLVTLLSSFDVFAIWAAVVLTIGVSIVAGIKRARRQLWCSAGGFCTLLVRPPLPPRPAKQNGVTRPADHPRFPPQTQQA